jgi:hypothetical protein
MVAMNAGRKHPWLIAGAAVLYVLFPHLQISAFTIFTGTASAADQRSYGEKKEVNTVEEARKALIKHFKKNDMVIGEIIEKDLYFEAEIRDGKDAVVDKVIVDKRTGRIRSIY